MGSMAESYDHFAWRASRPNVWERDIDEAEKAYTHLVLAYKGTGRMFFAVTGHIYLTTLIPDGKTANEVVDHVNQALRTAWLKLRIQCPTIASQVVWDSEAGKLKKRYEGLTRDVCDAWLEETFKLMKADVSGDEFANSDPPAPDMPTLFVRTGEALDSDGNKEVKSDIILRSPHDILDGIGTLNLFNNYVGHAADAYGGREVDSADFGTEWENLSPPLRVAAKLPVSITSEREVFLAENREKNAALRNQLDVASLPYHKGPQMPGKHQREALLLSQSETSALLKACKAAGVTPTHAFHAAIALAVGDLQAHTDKDRKMRYINYILQNERQRCAAPYNGSQHAAAVYHSLPIKSLYVDLDIPAEGKQVNETERKEHFHSIVKYMRDFYASVRDDKDSIYYIPAAFTNITPPWDGPLPNNDNPPVPPPNPTPSVSISSMGLVDRIIAPEQGAFSVHNPWVTGEELGTGYGLFLGTYRGELELSGAFNDAWHEREDMRTFLGACLGIVKRGFGLR